jgi:hypothetical protein
VRGELEDVGRLLPEHFLGEIGEYLLETLRDWELLQVLAGHVKLYISMTMNQLTRLVMMGTRISSSSDTSDTPIITLILQFRRLILYYKSYARCSNSRAFSV